MPIDSEPVEIVICLGSSCFARGNARNLAIIEEFLDCHKLKASVRFSGKLCQDECKTGPNLTIGGEAHHEVTEARLREILHQFGRRQTET